MDPQSTLTLSHDTAEVATVTVSHNALHLSAGAITTDGCSLLTFDRHYSPSISEKETVKSCILHVSANVSKCRGNVKDWDMKTLMDTLVCVHVWAICACNGDFSLTSAAQTNGPKDFPFPLF